MGGSQGINENTKKAIKIANFMSNMNSLKLDPGYYESKKLAAVANILKHTRNFTELDLSIRKHK
jgi:hypothetical protein